MGAPIQRLWHCVSPWPFRAEGVTMLMLAALPAAAAADDAEKVIAAPKDFIGQQVTASCQIAYAQETNPRKNNRDRCMVTLTGRVAVQSQKAFLTDPRIEWANK